MPAGSLAGFELAQQARDTPALVRVHRKRIDQVGESMGTFRAFMQKPARDGVSVTLVGDQVPAKQFPSSGRDPSEAGPDVGILVGQIVVAHI
jgi:hypothetical protein